MKIAQLFILRFIYIFNTKCYYWIFYYNTISMVIILYFIFSIIKYKWTFSFIIIIIIIKLINIIITLTIHRIIGYCFIRLRFFTRSSCLRIIFFYAIIIAIDFLFLIRVILLFVFFFLNLNFLFKLISKYSLIIF